MAAWPDDYLIPGLRPFHQEVNGIIYCADCREILPRLPKVDLVLTDPPYAANMNYLSYEDTEENWFLLMDAVIPLMRKAATMVIMPACKQTYLGWYYQHHKPDWLICWYKGSPGHRSIIGFSDWEALVVYGKNTNDMHDYLAVVNDEVMGKRGHPCPKPIKWARWLIKRASREEEIVCDPFLGSGTTAVAAKELGRRFIGIDLEEKYCEIAAKRLKEINPLPFFVKPQKRQGSLI